MQIDTGRERMRVALTLFPRHDEPTRFAGEISLSPLQFDEFCKRYAELTRQNPPVIRIRWFPNELATGLGVSVSTVHRYIESGLLKAYRMTETGAMYVLDVDLQEALRRFPGVSPERARELRQRLTGRQ